MLGRRERESPPHQPGPGDKNWFSRWEPPPQGLAAKATDLDALRTAVVDAAGVGYGLWFSYLFALLYFAIAAGAVASRSAAGEPGQIAVPQCRIAAERILHIGTAGLFGCARLRAAAFPAIGGKGWRFPRRA